MGFPVPVELMPVPLPLTPVLGPAEYNVETEPETPVPVPIGPVAEFVPDEG